MYIFTATLTRFRIHYGSTIFICNLGNNVICIQETQNSFICFFQPRNRTAISSTFKYHHKETSNVLDITDDIFVFLTKAGLCSRMLTHNI